MLPRINPWGFSLKKRRYKYYNPDEPIIKKKKKKKIKKDTKGKSKKRIKIINPLK